MLSLELQLGSRCADEFGQNGYKEGDIRLNLVLLLRGKCTFMNIGTVFRAMQKYE